MPSPYAFQPSIHPFSTTNLVTHQAEKPRLPFPQPLPPPDLTAFNNKNCLDNNYKEYTDI